MWEVKTKVVHDTSGLFGAGDITHRPCPAIMVGVKSINSYHFQVHFYMTATPQYWIEDDNKPSMRPETNKPPYRVPSMAEINALPWNGLKVASTFSGAGGSCLGYRMAGFRVVWANEFVPAAQDSYRANAAPDCVLDCRDIRTVKPEEILAATGLAVGELDLFDGSPPCQAFSTAGKREKGWGKAKVYEHGASQCNETLFSEYVRLLRGLKPKVFVAENVSGLVKGTAKGYFLEILAALKASGYRVTCRVLDAQWLGVPQQRQRTIFVGVREDLGLDPVHPKPLPYRYSVRDALPWIVGITTNREETASGDVQSSDRCMPSIRASDGKRVTTTKGGSNMGTVEAETDISRYAIGAERDVRGAFGQSGQITDEPSPAIMAGTVGNLWMRQSATEKRKFSIAELRRICAFPDDFVLTGSYAQQWERLGNSVPPVMMAAIAREIRERVLTP